ncbi:MAG: DNA polymerase III subunit delta [Oscillospiraceae bacterium]|nr:DNA polymerase III subunit delta [Oscillospiraceae bacterium]
MAKKAAENEALRALRGAITSGELKNLYILHGAERYLLERYVGDMREKLLPDGLGGFNYRRYEGRALTLDELREAVTTLPVFAERTLIEVHDFDIFKSGEETLTALTALFAELPEYVCLLFIYDTAEFKLDRRTKLAGTLKKYAELVEFDMQDQVKLAGWVKKHFADGGARISGADAAYLAFITGGYMEPLLREIEKLISYVKNGAVTRADIDAVVTPTLDAVSYKMMDAIVRRDFDGAAVILDELLRMREPPHKLMFTISLRMRQLLAARACLDNALGAPALMALCGLRYDFQAGNLLAAARNTDLNACRDAVLLCGETAYRLNDGGGEEAIVDLLVQLKRSAARP